MSDCPNCKGTGKVKIQYGRNSISYGNGGDEPCWKCAFPPVTLQQVADSGLNPFALDLIAKSFAKLSKGKNEPWLTLTYNGVEIFLRLKKTEGT